MAMCPNGHESVSTDYCDTCGAPMPPQAAPAPKPAPAPSVPEPAAPEQQKCPNCGAVNVPGALFCEACGYDFTTGTAPRPRSPLDLDDPGQPPAPAAPEEVEFAPAPAAPPSAEAEAQTPDPVAQAADAAETSDPEAPVADAAPAPVDADAAVDDQAGQPAAPDVPADEQPAPVEAPEQPTPVEAEPVQAPVEAEPVRAPVEAEHVSAPVEAPAPPDVPEAPIAVPPPAPAAVDVPPPSRQPAPYVPAPAPSGPAQWVAEVWIDPEWYAAQGSADALPSPGLPEVVPLPGTTALIGRTSHSRNIHPEIDCGMDNGVSRRQALLTYDGTRWWVEDQDSANGTFVGNPGAALPEQPIGRGRTELGDDQRIYVGAWTRIVVRPSTEDERQAFAS